LDLRYFGPKKLRTYQKSDLGHFGMTEVSRHMTEVSGAEVSYGISALDSTYIEDQTQCICKSLPRNIRE